MNKLKYHEVSVKRFKTLFIHVIGGTKYYVLWENTISEWVYRVGVILIAWMNNKLSQFIYYYYNFLLINSTKQLQNKLFDKILLWLSTLKAFQTELS